MTIEKIYNRREISSYTYNVCIANRIKTLKELLLHYFKDDTFKNLTYCSGEADAELKEVYYKYKEWYIYDKRTQSVYINKSDRKLGDVVTDFDEMMGATLTSDSYLEELEQKLQDYWNKKREASIKAIFDVTDIVDLEEAKQTIKDYWRNKAIEEGAEYDIAESSVKIASELTGLTIFELEQKLNKYWKEKGYYEA